MECNKWYKTHLTQQGNHLSLLNCHFHTYLYSYSLVSTTYKQKIGDNMNHQELHLDWQESMACKHKSQYSVLHWIATMIQEVTVSPLLLFYFLQKQISQWQLVKQLSNKIHLAVHPLECVFEAYLF